MSTKTVFVTGVGLIKNNKIFYRHCKCLALVVLSVNEEKFHKHINILQAFKVIPKTVNCALPTMWKSTNTIGFAIAEVCHNQASNCNDNVISCTKSVPTQRSFQLGD